ncbi:hypothetical protein Efla_005387 [Eimeria flavescens]
MASQSCSSSSPCCCCSCWLLQVVLPVACCLCASPPADGRAAAATTEAEQAAAKTLSVHHERVAAARKREGRGPSESLTQRGAPLYASAMRGGPAPALAWASRGIFSSVASAVDTPQNSAARGRLHPPAADSSSVCSVFYSNAPSGAPSAWAGEGGPSAGAPGSLGALSKEPAPACEGGPPCNPPARLRRVSVCSLASLAACSVAAGKPASSADGEELFAVYVHSILDLEEKEIGQRPMQVRIAPANQQQRLPLLQQQPEDEEALHAAAAKALLSAEASSSSSSAPAAVSRGLLFLAVRSRVVCFLPAQRREVFVGLVRRGPWGPPSDTLVGFTCINVDDQRLLSLQQWLLRSAETPAVGAVLLKRQ